MCLQIQSLASETRKYLWVGRPRAGLLDSGPPALSPAANAFPLPAARPQEVGRSIEANSFFPDPALSHSTAQTWGEFIVRKCSTCPAATRKEIASHSNPQKPIGLKPGLGADLPSLLPRHARGEWDWASSVFLTPVFFWNRGEGAVSCFILFYLFFVCWPCRAARGMVPQPGIEPGPPQ